MSDYLTFEAAIEPMVWGRNTYTVLPLPEEIVEELGRPKRVEGELADHPINLAVTRGPRLDTAFLYTGKALLTAAQITTGELINVRLRAADPDFVEVPDDLALALRQAALSDIWEGLTPGKRRGLIVPVETAKRAETRSNRIQKLLTALQEGT